MVKREEKLILEKEIEFAVNELSDFYNELIEYFNGDEILTYIFMNAKNIQDIKQVLLLLGYKIVKEVE